jgi:hypothetical protein
VIVIPELAPNPKLFCFMQVSVSMLFASSVGVIHRRHIKKHSLPRILAKMTVRPSAETLTKKRDARRVGRGVSDAYSRDELGRTTLDEPHREDHADDPRWLVVLH